MLSLRRVGIILGNLAHEEELQIWNIKYISMFCPVLNGRVLYYPSSLL